MEIVVVMPPMGDGSGDLAVNKWLKAVGDRVVKGEPLFEVYTDKVEIEVEALVTGTLTRIIVEAGQEAEAGDPIAYVQTDEEA